MKENIGKRDEHALAPLPAAVHLVHVPGDAFIPAGVAVSTLPVANCARVDAQTSSVDRCLVRVDRSRLSGIITIALAPHWYTPRAVWIASEAP